MAKINLLPWRAERRAQRQKEFYGMLGVAAAIAVGLSVLIYMYYGAQIDGQQERNTFLQGQIQEVEAQITQIDELDKQRDRLLARKKVIEELQANRSQMVHLFDSLVRTIPDGVILTSIKQDGNILTLQGRSQSNARVSTYMRNLEGSGWMSKPDLSIIEAKQADDAAGAPKPVVPTSRALPYAFTLTVQLAEPGASSPEATPVDGAAPAANPPAAAPAAPSPPAAQPAPQGTPAS
ncbi:PilN domain-containing protein [Pseudoxanthomonas composti]|uniref:Fimbrial protein n=1 Tax=Pseudoxanthomonas composti TaxID=2137479 RepID=A0A4Q1JU42_9GAMM|nr:PilN domain-containing protein [Pseudoxanthomonas composti]RXR04272.1 fimbrial protein [Pseudoxanthomonas composti]